jgi:hypothetical protein
MKQPWGRSADARTARMARTTRTTPPPFAGLPRLQSARPVQPRSDRQYDDQCPCTNQKHLVPAGPEMTPGIRMTTTVPDPDQGCTCCGIRAVTHGSSELQNARTGPTPAGVWHSASNSNLWDVHTTSQEGGPAEAADFCRSGSVIKIPIRRPPAGAVTKLLLVVEPALQAAPGPVSSWYRAARTVTLSLPAAWEGRVVRGPAGCSGRKTIASAGAAHG